MLAVSGAWHPHSGLLRMVGQRARCTRAKMNACRAGFGQWAGKEEAGLLKKRNCFSFYFQMTQHTTQF
jgi:hypothetical protein